MSGNIPLKTGFRGDRPRSHSYPQTPRQRHCQCVIIASSERIKQAPTDPRNTPWPHEKTSKQQALAGADARHAGEPERNWRQRLPINKPGRQGHLQRPTTIGRQDPKNLYVRTSSLVTGSRSSKNPGEWQQEKAITSSSGNDRNLLVLGQLVRLLP